MTTRLKNQKCFSNDKNLQKLCFYHHHCVHQQSMKNQVYILLDLKADHWHASVITQVVSLNSHDLFLVILATHIK